MPSRRARSPWTGRPAHPSRASPGGELSDGQEIAARGTLLRVPRRQPVWPPAPPAAERHGWPGSRSSLRRGTVRR